MTSASRRSRVRVRVGPGPGAAASSTAPATARRARLPTAAPTASRARAARTSTSAIVAACAASRRSQRRRPRAVPLAQGVGGRRELADDVLVGADRVARVSIMPASVRCAPTASASSAARRAHDDDLRPRVAGPVEHECPAGPRGPHGEQPRRRQRAELGALHVEATTQPRSSGDADTSSERSRAGLRHHPMVCTPTSGPNRSTVRSASVRARSSSGVRRVTGVEHQVDRGAVAAGQPLDDVLGELVDLARRTRRAGRSRRRAREQPVARGRPRGRPPRPRAGRARTGLADVVLLPQRRRGRGEHAHGVVPGRADDADVAARGGGQRRRWPRCLPRSCTGPTSGERLGRRCAQALGAQSRRGRAAAVEQPRLRPVPPASARAACPAPRRRRSFGRVGDAERSRCRARTPDSWFTTACQRGRCSVASLSSVEHPAGPRQADAQDELLEDRRPHPERLDAGDVLAGQHEVDALAPAAAGEVFQQLRRPGW